DGLFDFNWLPAKIKARLFSRLDLHDLDYPIPLKAHSRLSAVLKPFTWKRDQASLEFITTVPANDVQTLFADMGALLQVFERNVEDWDTLRVRAEDRVSYHLHFSVNGKRRLPAAQFQQRVEAYNLLLLLRFIRGGKGTAALTTKLVAFSLDVTAR